VKEENISRCLKKEAWKRKFESKRDEFARRMCLRSISLALFTQYCYERCMYHGQ